MAIENNVSHTDDDSDDKYNLFTEVEFSRNRTKLGENENGGNEG